MGEALARQRAEAFAKQQDEAYIAELKSNHLFSKKPEVFHTDYPCRLLPGQTLKAGTEVILRQASTADDSMVHGPAKRVDVILWNQLAATMQNEAGLALSEIMDSDPLSREGVPARVISESPLDGFVSVRCIEEKHDEES